METDRTRNEPRLAAHELVGQRQDQNEFLARLITPRSLSLMMMTGGGLLVSGFLVWLWSAGAFDNPVILSFTVGFANLSILAFGCWLFAATRFQLASKGIMLLGSVVLPLNLWLYDSQGLISIDQGQPLWVAALVCCSIYAAIARFTKDHWFVYAIVGGVGLTGMLFLAGSPTLVQWSAQSITTFLLIVGVVSILAEKTFIDSPSDFSRDKFGLAFYRAGHAVLVLGLGILFGGQSTSSLFSTAVDCPWTAGLLTTFTGVYLLNFLQTRQVVHLFAASIVIIWNLVTTLIWFEVEIGIEAGCALISGLLIIANFVQGLTNSTTNRIAAGTSLVMSCSVLSWSIVVFVLGLPIQQFSSWLHLANIALPSLALLTFPGSLDSRRPWLSAWIPVVAGIGLSTSMVIVVAGFQLNDSPSNLLIAMVIATIGSILLAGFHRTSLQLEKLGISLTAAPILIWITQSYLASSPILWSSASAIAMTGLATVGLANIAFFSGNRVALLGGSLTAMASIFQTAVYFQLNNGFAATTIATTTGLLIFSLSRTQFIEASCRRHGWDPEMGKNIGHVLVVFGSVGATLFVFTQLLEGLGASSHVYLTLVHIFLIGTAAMGCGSRAWRQVYFCVAIGLSAVLAYTIASISTLTIGQKIEVASVVIGVVLLGAGLVGWYKEQSDQSDLVSFNLIVGSSLICLPLIVGITVDRWHKSGIYAGPQLFHEVGLFMAGLMLLGIGLLARLKAPTICGGLALSSFVLSNVFLINFPEKLQSTSVMMMVGGGLFFATAVVLSIYRDRVLMLPNKIRAKTGWFKFLNWR